MTGQPTISQEVLNYVTDQSIDSETRTRYFFKTISIESLQSWIKIYRVGLGLEEATTIKRLDNKPVDARNFLCADHMRPYMQRGLDLALEELNSRS